MVAGPVPRKFDNNNAANNGRIRFEMWLLPFPATAIEGSSFFLCFKHWYWSGGSFERWMPCLCTIVRMKLIVLCQLTIIMNFNGIISCTPLFSFVHLDPGCSCVVLGKFFLNKHFIWLARGLSTFGHLGLFFVHLLPTTKNDLSEL